MNYWLAIVSKYKVRIISIAALIAIAVALSQVNTSSCNVTTSTTITNSTANQDNTLTSTKSNAISETRDSGETGGYCAFANFVGKDGNLATIIAAIAAALIAAWYSPKIKEEFDIRAQYVVPFAKWCADVYGVISEFEELCNRVKYKKPGSDNDVHLIFHVYEMHKAVEEGYKWLGKIKKEDLLAEEYFDDLFDGVDGIWHLLENKNRKLIGKQASSDDFRLVLQTLLEEDTCSIANLIRTKLADELYFKDDFPTVKAFLFERIPPKGPGGREKTESPKDTTIEFMAVEARLEVERRDPKEIEQLPKGGETFTTVVVNFELLNNSNTFVEIHGIELRLNVFREQEFIEPDPRLPSQILAPEERVYGQATFKLYYMLGKGQTIENATLYLYHSAGRESIKIPFIGWPKPSPQT